MDFAEWMFYHQYLSWSVESFVQGTCAALASHAGSCIAVLQQSTEQSVRILPEETSQSL